MVLTKLFSIILIFTLANCDPLTDNDVLQYLEKYGYTNGKEHKEMSNKEVDAAVKLFQKQNSLIQTGSISEEIKDMMEKPRCGMPDIEFAKASSRTRKWRKSHLTYKFVNYPRNNLDRAIARREVQKAFNIWAVHTPLTFELRHSGNVDIEIRFYGGANGDGPGRTLAYAYFPENGDAYFDDENWTSSSTRKGFNLYVTGAHEFGHSIGLTHSEFRGALMYPYVPSNTPNIRLHRDDVRRIQRLYGRRMNRLTVCMMGDVNAALFTSEDTLFIIKDDHCWKYKNRNLLDGYPKLITNEWPGLPDSINAAYYYDNSFYFLKDNLAWIYNSSMRQETFEGTSDVDIDAALTVDNRLYVFHGSFYWRIDYTKKGSKLQANYPKTISNFWKGVPSDIQAAFYDNKKYVYFFKGENVYIFDLHNTEKDAVSQNISDWLNCDNE